VVSSFIKRAAICVALFVLASSSPMTAFFKFVPAAQAKMRQDRLTVEPAGGGAGHAFNIEVASTEQEKALGLMFRTELGDGEGMLFPYNAERSLSMWMHNTYISLDMLFIRSDGTIARIEERAEPLSDRIISSGPAVAAVLEIPGGAASRLGIKPGDKVRYPAFGGVTAH
jgi:uncharacterized membrane protein (UPF0127 family)